MFICLRHDGILEMEPAEMSGEVLRGDGGGRVGLPPKGVDCVCM